MKKLFLSLTTIAALLFAASPAFAAPPTPSQCTGMVFDHVIVSSIFGDFVQGTSGRDLIFATKGSYILGLGGNDCIVTSDGLNAVDAGTGNDKVVLSGQGNFVNGGTGTNDCYNVNDSDYTLSCINH